MGEPGETLTVEQVDLNLNDTLSQALDLWKQRKDVESGKVIRKASKMFVDSNPDRSYIPGATENEKAKNSWVQNYDSPVTKTILQMVEQRTLEGTDQFTSIYQVALAITPEYTDNRDVLVKTGKAKTMEEFLSAEGVACRHQAHITAKVGLIIKRDNPQEDWNAKIVAFPKGFEIHGQISSEGHFFTELSKKDLTGLFDITNPRLTTDKDGKVIQGKEEEVFAKLFETYKDRGISVPKLTTIDTISYREKEFLPPNL